MEPVAYASHRWVMHGLGWGLHASHHEARPRGFENNDWYPVGFAAVTVAAMSLAAGRRWRTVLAAGAGITAYGAAYAVVHELYAHRRVPSLRPASRPLEALGQRHLHHHRRGGEPFGMLAPVVIDRGRSPAAGDPLVEVGTL
jgi:beta-carotene 3-hydroxylase